MQTFLPKPDFRESVELLDSQRLWKQVLETFQLCEGQWPNHPASIMWRGFEDALRMYGYSATKAAIRRGIRVNEKYLDYFSDAVTSRLPWWFGNEDFHRSHLLNLKWKWNPVGEQPPYVWPVHREEWELIPFGVKINRRKKPIIGIRKELVSARTTTGKPCYFLLEGFE